jgi:HK97 gp10 family phage protein
MEELTFSLTVNNADLTKKNVREAAAVALEEIGMLAERYAKMLCPVDTGNLRNSITHTVDEGNLVAYLGTPVEYATYVEYGTGVHGENGGTGAGWWVYVTGGGSGQNKVHGKRYTEQEARKIVAILKSKGLDAHMTQGQKPTHFLKNAVQEHADEYKAITEMILQSD